MREWAFSVSYNRSPLETDQFLKIRIKHNEDYFMTFAMDSLWGRNQQVPNDNGVAYGQNSNAQSYRLRLVRVHANDFNPGSAIYPYLCRFTLRNAGSRVLTANDFNTKIGEQTYTTTLLEGGIQLNFTPDATAESNPFSANKFIAEPGTQVLNWSSQYIQLRSTTTGQYLTAQDAAVDYSNCYNSSTKTGTRYPKFGWTSSKENDGRNEFRLVYYPSEDSVIINVRKIKNPSYGLGNNYIVEDNGVYQVGFDGLFNYNVNNYLTVHMQTLNTDPVDKDVHRVITVSNGPANTHISFGVQNDCQAYDASRSSVDEKLYMVKDRDGRYLVIDLGNGDFTPTWKRLETPNTNNNGVGEDPRKIPSYQWLVLKVDRTTNPGKSRIHLINRELPDVRIEYVQLYEDYRIFTGQANFADNYNPEATYEPALNTKYVRKDCFIEVPSIYCTDPFLGYKYMRPDTLDFYGYAFNYLTYIGDNYYIGLKNGLDDTDSTMRVDEEATYFGLELPDTLNALIAKNINPYGTESYGVGTEKDQAWDHLIISETNPTGIIAKLQRAFYYVKVSDYWRYNLNRNDQYIVIDDNGRYAFTSEQNANTRSLGKTKFYFRYSYDKNGREYYALLDRIDKSDFDYMTEKYNLPVLHELKTNDGSYGSIESNSFGVLLAQVDDANNYITIKPKNQDRHTSTFALQQINEPLYRRFNDAKTDGGKDGDDAPRLLKFYDVTNADNFLFEDANSSKALPYNVEPRINYLGMEQKSHCDVSDGDWHKSHNYIIYVDTAYVNRGTGRIKPQYMLVMNPQISEPREGITACGEAVTGEYSVYGRYLFNAMRLARLDPGNIDPHAAIRDDHYLWHQRVRPVFVDAIHMGDSLYILKGQDPSTFDAQCNTSDGKPLNILSKRKLINAQRAGLIDIEPLDNNRHKDYVFSMRFKNRQIGKDGQPTGADKSFYIESETTNRDTVNGRTIAPMEGGWISYPDEVPAISRGSFGSPLVGAFPYDVMKAETDDVAQATSNDEVATVKVIGGTDRVSILNAANKRVVISNILGQTVANTVLTGDNVTVAAPKGVIVVAVEGEETVKAVVK
jgi:hypothetical protein